MAAQPPVGAFIVVDNLHLLAQTVALSPGEAEACAGIRKGGCERPAITFQ
jgi:hypothetical protein